MVSGKIPGTFSVAAQSDKVCEKTEDLDLAREAVAGSKAAFEKIVTRHQAALYRLAFRFFNNEEDSLDAVQEVYIKAYKALPGFEGRSSLKTWLYRIATNTFMTLAKEKGRRKKTILESIIDWFSRTPVPDPAKTVVHREYQEELQEAIQRKMEKIPEVYRLPLILKDFENKPLEEISEILEIPEGTVKSRINRGRRLLQEVLEPFFRERSVL